MSTKDPLKKLMRRFPAPAELKATLTTLSQGDDRTVALVGASILEALLERFIKTKLPVCDTTLAGQLFYNRGPLSDFHGKIIVAHAAGYITPPMANELLLVKAIRNVFAHAVVGVSFETAEVRQKMQDSLMLKAMNSVDTDGKMQSAFNANANGFALVVHILAILLDSNHQQAGGDPFMEFVRQDTPDSDRYA